MTDLARPALPWYALPAVVIASGCIVAMINFGVRSTFGQFTLPVSEAHAWPREIYSFALALQNLVWGVATPIAGMFSDRFGAARVIIAGAAIYALGVAVMAFAAGPMVFHLGGGVLVGAGIAASSFGIVAAAFAGLVPPERRSWAFGVATAAGSLGQFTFNILGGGLISAFGWQQALVILAFAALAMIPFALPLWSGNAVPKPAEAGDLTMRRAIAEAFGSRSYLLLTAGFFVCGFQIAFVTVHLPPYLKEHGISTELAGLAMALIGLFNVIGSYSAGIVGGRTGGKRYPLALIYLLRSIAVSIFILLPITGLSTVLFTATLGVLWLSTVPLTMGLVVVMFGQRFLATLYGFVFLSHQVGSFLGVWLGGRLYDAFGSYDPVWWIGVALGLFAFIVHLPIKEAREARFAAA